MSCPPDYRAVLQLARLILIGAVLDLDSGVGGQACTLSLASVWQRSLRRLIRQISHITGWTLVPDSALDSTIG